MTIVNQLPSPTYVQTSVLCTATFTAVGTNTPTDPENIVFKWATQNSGVAPEVFQYGNGAAITRVSTGVYSITIYLYLIGDTTFEWIGTGPVTCANAATFAVQGLPL